MADMTKIVGAVIAITVRGYIVSSRSGKCDCNFFSFGSHYRGRDRIRWSPCRVEIPAFCNHRTCCCGYYDGCCQAHFQQELNLMYL